MTANQDDDVEAARTLIGLVVARHDRDRAAEAALWYGGDGPVDERQLLAVACGMLHDLAEKVGAAEDPPAGADDGLRRMASDLALEEQ